MTSAEVFLFTNTSSLSSHSSTAAVLLALLLLPSSSASRSSLIPCRSLPTPMVSQKGKLSHSGDSSFAELLLLWPALVPGRRDDGRLVSGAFTDVDGRVWGDRWWGRLLIVIGMSLVTWWTAVTDMVLLPLALASLLVAISTLLGTCSLLPNW